MKSELPNEIWGMIVRQATVPGAAPMTWPGRRIAALFDPDSLEDQSRYPWRKGFKHPVDTPISIGTKLALMRVSRQFYDLSRRYVFENLHFHDVDISRLQNLQELLAQRPPCGTATAGSWVKNIYIMIAEDTPMTTAWADIVIAIVRQSSALQAFFMILDSGRSDAAFWNAQTRKIAKAVPPCIRHFEWNCPSSWMDSITAFPMQEIAELFRCARGLRAIRISACHVDLPLGDDVTLPELRYLYISAHRQTMDWPKLSSLTHVTFSGLFPKPTQLPGPIGGTLPVLSFLYFSQRGLLNDAGCFCDMLAATPNLRTLIYSRSFPIPREHGFWALAQNSSLQRFEIQFDHNFTPGDFGHVDHDLEIDFAALREHVLPFADPHKFPALACFKLGGFRYIRKRFGEKEPRLDELASRALTDLKSRGVRVVVED